MFRLLSIMIECISSAVFVIPAVLLWQYKIEKQKNFHKLLMLLIFLFYIIAICSVTGIPTVDTLNTIDFSINIIPFKEIINSPIEYIKNSILNIILFIPVGFLLPVIWKEYDSFKKTALTGLILSVIIEILQIFTFRLTDIDDIITNTLGTVLGYCIAKIILTFVSYKIVKISNDNAIKNESIIILMLAFLISFLLKPLVSNSLWEILLESSLWEQIR